MSRKWLLKAVAWAKSEGGVDTFLRYNPLLLRRVKSLIDACPPGQEPAALMKRILTAACQASYGKDKTSDFGSWPILEKELVRSQPKNFINPSCLLKTPAGTGGTSGVPLTLWRSLECMVAEQYFIDRLLAPSGFSMRSRLAVLRGDSVKDPADTNPPFGKLSHGGKRLTLSSKHLNPQTLRAFYEEIKAFAPDILWVYPNAVSNLLALCEREGLKLHIPVILASSEMLPAELHTGLERYFGSRVVNYYGQAERVCFAWSERAGEFYFEPLYGKAELIPTGNSVEGQREFKVLGTAYWNLAMPLVRYDTGDLIYLPESCTDVDIAAIAAGKMPFKGMAGREGEYVLTREGMRIIGLNQIPRELKHVLQIQLVQRDYDDLLIQVIPMQGFNEADKEQILAQARQKIPASMQVEIKTVDALYLTKRGKAPLVVRQMAEPAPH